MKAGKRILPIFLLFVVAGVGTWFFQKQQQKNGDTIVLSGTLETREVRLAFRIPGEIDRLLKDEGDTVQKGEVVALLNTDELTRIQKEAEASLHAAAYTAEQAREDSARIEQLFQAGSVSAQKRDTVQTHADAAAAQVDALRASLDLAVTRLGFAELHSPVRGIVLTRSAEPGEIVQPGTVLFTVADVTDVWVTGYVNEQDLGKIFWGQKAYVGTDTFPGKKYEGSISFISQEAEFTPKYIQTTEERVKLVYRIKIKVSNEQLELKPGMPVDVSLCMR